MFDTREKPKMVESAYLIGAYFDRADEPEARSLLAELVELVSTLGIATLLTGVDIHVAVAHQAVGALLVASAVWTAHRLAVRRG